MVNSRSAWKALGTVLLAATIAVIGTPRAAFADGCDARFVAFNEGDPGLPGDGVVATTTTFWYLSPAADLSAVTDWVTVSVYPAVDGIMSFTLLDTSSGIDVGFAVGAEPTSYGSVSGSYFRIGLNHLEGAAALLRNTYGTNTTASDFVLWRFALLGAGGYVTALDGAAVGLGYACVPVQPVIDVSVDVRPGSAQNVVNPKSNGVLPVAILTTGSFDAATVNPATVRFGVTGIEAAVAHSSVEDVNSDGLPDMLLHFRVQAAGFTCTSSSASLTGRTLDDLAISGSDTIVTVGCGQK